MLWLNPSDNQGARLLIGEVDPWREKAAEISNVDPLPLVFSVAEEFSAPGAGGSTRRIRPGATELEDSHSPLAGQKRKLRELLPPMQQE
jgi:hypothetical protein